MKRIVICSDGTWNRPEKDLDKDQATNVLKFARSIKPMASDGTEHVVFYDWGIGSYHDSVSGGAFGKGLEKNVMDAYRFIVHNYKPKDELYFFGFSRGAYTVRSLCGLINNCHILRKSRAKYIQAAFEWYKDRSGRKHPSSSDSVAFRKRNSVPDSGKVHFLGVWDTVGAIGLPKSLSLFVDERHIFYDNKIGSIVETARHALSIDETRDDFEPTLWARNNAVDLKQVWFAGVHSDVGGGYPRDKKRTRLSDIPMLWMKRQAEQKGLEFKHHIVPSRISPLSEQHEEASWLFRLLGTNWRKFPEGRQTIFHESVKKRYEGMKYRPDNLKKHVRKYGWRNLEV